MFKSMFLLASTTQVQAWWGEGHLLTARIAYDKLQAEDPDRVKNVEKVLSFLKTSDPGWTTSEKDHPFVECATFADDIKHKGGSYQSGWHFIDTPFLDEGGSIDDYDFTMDSHNVTEAISGIVNWFNKEGDYKNSNAYTQIQSHGLKGHSENDGLSTAMRLLIHYVGDIHQPLHATSRVDHEYTKGDRGGNMFPVVSKDGAKNLHSVWDSVIYSFHNDDKLPFTTSTWTRLGKDAKALVAQYEGSVSTTQASDLDPMSWAQESFEITSKTVYTNIKEGDAPSTDYIAANTKLAQRQIVVGGMRLANLLKSIDFSDFESVSQRTRNNKSKKSKKYEKRSKSTQVHKTYDWTKPAENIMEKLVEIKDQISNDFDIDFPALKPMQN